MPTWPLVLTFSHQTGHTILFTDQSGMNASGHVMLGTMDVHHQWTKVMCVSYPFNSLKSSFKWLLLFGQSFSLSVWSAHHPCCSVCAALREVA